MNGIYGQREWGAFPWATADGLDIVPMHDLGKGPLVSTHPAWLCRIRMGALQGEKPGLENSNLILHGEFYPLDGLTRNYTTYCFGFCALSLLWVESGCWTHHFGLGMRWGPQIGCQVVSMWMFLKLWDWMRSLRYSDRNKKAKEPQWTQTFRAPMKVQKWA